MLASPVIAGHVEVMPTGARVDGHVVNVESDGARRTIWLTLDSCERDGVASPVSTDMVVRGGRHGTEASVPAESLAGFTLKQALVL